MSGLTAADWGRLGNAALRRRYPKNVLRAWARRGGRKRNRTLAEIQAGIVPSRARTQKTRREEGEPIAAIVTRFE